MQTVIMRKISKNYTEDQILPYVYSAQNNHFISRKVAKKPNDFSAARLPSPV